MAESLIESKRAVTGKMKTKPERGLLIKPKRNDQVLNYDDSSRLTTSQSAKTTIKVNAKRIPKFERGSIINSK